MAFLSRENRQKVLILVVDILDLLGFNTAVLNSGIPPLCGWSLS